MKLVKILENPLGMNMAFKPRHHHFIGAAIGLAGSVLSSVIGGAASKKANKEAEERQRRQEAVENGNYLRKYNQDYADTAAGQNLIRRAKDMARDNWRKAAGAQAVAGGTDAATAQAKEAGSKMVGDTLANVAATDQGRKERADELHQQAQDKFAQMDMARSQQRANNIASVAGAASNAMMQAVGGAVDGAKAPAKAQTNNNGTSLTGGNNGGQQVTVPVGSTGMTEDADTMKRMMQG